MPFVSGDCISFIQKKPRKWPLEGTSFAGALRRAGGQQFPDQRLRRPGGASAASPGNCRGAVAGPEQGVGGDPWESLHKNGLVLTINSC